MACLQILLEATRPFLSHRTRSRPWTRGAGKRISEQPSRRTVKSSCAKAGNRSWWGDWWHIYPQGWNLDDFNAELVRHGCERYSSTSASSAQICLLVELKCDRIDAAQRKMKERVDSGGSGPTLGPESAPFRLLCCLRGHRRLTEACGCAGRQRWGGRRAWRQADDRLGPSTGAKQEADPELHGTMPASTRLTAL